MLLKLQNIILKSVNLFANSPLPVQFCELKLQRIKSVNIKALGLLTIYPAWQLDVKYYKKLADRWEAVNARKHALKCKNRTKPNEDFNYNGT